jgi:hypothetical protein
MKLNVLHFTIQRFGQQAGNYELVITAARHYWNAIKPFISEPIERELLKDPLEAVLGCIAAVAEKTTGKEDEVGYQLKNMCQSNGPLANQGIEITK